MRRNIDNVMSELIIACGVAVAVIIGMCIVVHQQHDIWQEQRDKTPSVGNVEAPQTVLNEKTGN